MENELASLTVSIDAPTNQRWSGTFPVEVRDGAKLVLRARGVSEEKLQVPAGQYFVTVLLPNGQQAGGDAIVDLRPGEDKQVRLSIRDLDFPASLREQTRFESSAEQDNVSVTEESFKPTTSIIRGNWLKAKLLGPGASMPVVREPTTSSRIEVDFTGTQAWVEITGPTDCTYLAVPVHPGRSTTMEWNLNQNSGELQLRFDFSDGQLNSFFDFVQSGKALEARSISQSIIAQSEQFMMDKMASPLRAILGAYVLLRANQDENMDRWTAGLIRFCDWIPDALAIRVEYLARNGDHSAALNLLLDVGTWGTPWGRSGIAYLEKRAKLYASVGNSGRSNLDISGDRLTKIKDIARVFSELVAALDMTQTTAVLRNFPRIP